MSGIARMDFEVVAFHGVIDKGKILVFVDSCEGCEGGIEDYELEFRIDGCFDDLV